MKTKKIKILIVGAGLAGLGCAHELFRLGRKDFLVISKDIGGRAPDAEKTIPRATFYARTEYKNLEPFLVLGRKADVMQGRLIGNDKVWKPLKILLNHPITGLRFYFLVREFDKHYTKFAERCEQVSQKTAFEEDPYLLRLYQQSAVDFLKEKNLESLQEELIGTLVRVTRFITIQEASAFLMFWIWLILVKNGWECTIDFKKITATFLDKVVEDEVVSVDKAPKGWEVKTKQGNYYECETLIVATPITVSKKLLSINLPDQKTTTIYSVIVQGKPWPKYNHGRYNVLPSNEKDVVVVQNEDGTFMFCSTRPDFTLSTYFESFEILEKKDWNPAGFFGNTLIEAKQAKNLYVIGDYHFPGLEAAFITGIQAARSIAAE